LLYKPNLKENFELALLNVAIKKRDFCEYCKVIYKYYKNKTFRKIDLTLLCSYFFSSPFKISKVFLINQGEKEIHAYGETPLTTLEEIFTQCQVSAGDRVFEMGSGRGRSCFWLNCFVGCQVVGVDYIPAFIEKAQKVKEKYDVKGVEFREENFLRTNLKGATVIYLYGILLEEPFLKKLVKRFSKLPIGTKFITVSYPLNDYTKEPLFEVIRSFPATFNWGEADVYLQVRK
jgi:Methyltransferase domain